MLDQFVDSHPNAKAYDVLGSNYLNALKHVDAVVGNSSSGLYEAPSFGIASVNIGERQKGRLQAESVINCEAERKSIRNAIDIAMNESFSSTRNPFGDGRTSESIVAALCAISNPVEMLQKHFYMEE